MKHVDSRLNVEKEIVKDDLSFRSVLEEPFSVHGVFYENGLFRRMPEDVARSVSDKVYTLHSNTSGGRVRFKTDSDVVAISVKYGNRYRSSHFALSGSAGLDLYVREEGEDRERFYAAFMPPYDMIDSYESRHTIEGGRKTREITINMPLYSDVAELRVGVLSDASLLPADPYPRDELIVYYGNSITQGACASRPGNAFAAQASRAFGCDFINLGFSGSGKAEDEIADYISGLDMQIFVYDYDHNAPNPEYLAATHEKMFKRIRRSHPNIPIIMLTRTSMDSAAAKREERKAIIKATYDNAVAAGDKNVYFIDGSHIYDGVEDIATVERCHPNDLGQTYIAFAIQKVLGEILA